MSEIKTGGLDQYGAGLFEQQFCGAEWANKVISSQTVSLCHRFSRLSVLNPVSASVYIFGIYIICQFLTTY